MEIKMTKPFLFNLAALAVVPMLATKASTAEAQVDMIYYVADDPATPKYRATQLAALAGKMLNKMNRR
jgi:hypothetical protein